jgi:hypothetical protein
VIDSESELLEGFEFNVNAPLGTTMYAPYTATIGCVAGTLTLDIPSLVPANLIAAAGGTTHFKLVSAGAEIDFEQEVFVVDQKESVILPWDTNAPQQ